MAWLSWTLPTLAVLTGLAIAVQAARRPILFRMATRNAARRPRQTATVIAGLMIGTAIIAAAVVAGDSAQSGIRGAVYDALGPVDETVRADTVPFFPEAVYDRLQSDPEVRAAFDGFSPSILWDVAADSPRTDLFEPRVTLVGFDPQSDADFGDFTLRDGTKSDGTDLNGGIYITDDLADALDIGRGDELHVAYTLPIDPILPELLYENGTVDLALGGVEIPVVGTLPDVDPTPSTHTFHVRSGARGIVVALGPDEGAVPSLPPTSTLSAKLEAPDGTVHRTDPTPPGSRPSYPLWINVTAPADGSLPTGDWTLTVAGSPGVAMPYQAGIAVLYPVYDISELSAGYRRLEQGPLSGFEPMEALQERREATFRIAGVTDGGRGDMFDIDHGFFLPLDAAQDLLHRDGQINLIKVSNPGGVRGGEGGTEAATLLLEDRLAALRDAYPDLPVVQALEVHKVKQEFLQIADDAGQLMTNLLLFAGSLSIITGLLLIINIFTMLAEERRSELGMARAVGLTRRDLMRLFLFEGSLYAVVAAAIGALMGLGLAYLLIQGLNALLAARPGAEFPPIPFAPSWGAWLAAFSAGALMTFGTIAGASRRQSRLNIVRAIRCIEEPERGYSRLTALSGIPLAAAGLGAAVVGWWTGQFSMQVFGPLAFVVGLGVTLRRYAVRRHIDPPLAAALALYYAATFFVIQDFDNVQEANIVGPVRGVLMTLCFVVLMVYWTRGPRLVGAVLGRFRHLRAIALLAVSYPLHKRFRTGMTLAMFAIVLLSIGFFSIFGALFEVDPARQTGGYDIEATTTLPVEDLSATSRGIVPDDTFASIQHLVDYTSPDPYFITVNGERTGQYGPPVHHVYGFDADFAADQEFRLLWRAPEYATDQEAYEAVLHSDDLVIAAYPYSTDQRNQDLAHKVGDSLELHIGEPGRTYTIVGFQEQSHFPGIWLPKEQVERLLPRHASLFLYRLAGDDDAADVAKLLERDHRDVGMDAEASQALVAQEQESFRQVLGAMKLFLGLGLIVGILSLAIVTSRSVLERRQEIGMLRALGYTPRMVRRVFLIEVFFTIVVGAVLGLLSSIIVTYGLWVGIIRELHYPYVIPWVEIAWILGISTVVALLATAAPVRRSAKVAPAEALRYVE